MPAPRKRALLGLRGVGAIQTVEAIETISTADAVARLEVLDAEGLRSRWRAVTGRTAPTGIPKFLLVRALAYRLPDGPVPLTLTPRSRLVRCTRCGSANTALTSEFGATPCKSLHRCRSCAEPFERVKEI